MQTEFSMLPFQFEKITEAINQKLLRPMSEFLILLSYKASTKMSRWLQFYTFKLWKIKFLFLEFHTQIVTGLCEICQNFDLYAITSCGYF